MPAMGTPGDTADGGARCVVDDVAQGEAAELICAHDGISTSIKVHRPDLLQV